MGLDKRIIITFLGFLFIAFIYIASFFTGEKNKEKSNFWDCKNCNVVIISMTSARMDHLSTYGYSKDTSPNISKLAQNGIIFTNAFTQGSRTIGAGLSLFTSYYPYTHRVFDQFYSKKDLNPSVQSLTEILKRNGYKTAAFTGGGHYKGIYGFDEGFDTYEDSQDFVGFGTSAPKAVEWLKKVKQPFFLFIQGFDAHCPYTPPSPYNRMFDPDYTNKNNIDYSICYWSYYGTKPIEGGRGRKFPLKKVTDWGGVTKGSPEEDWKEEFFDKGDIQHLVSLYDGSIAYADSEIQKVLDTLYELKLDKNTIIVFLADHGELLGENGRFMRGGYLTGTYHDAVVHIPLIVKYPKMKGGKKVDGLVQVIDIAPTLLEFLNIPNYTYGQGKSLLRLIKTGEKINEYVYGGTSQYRKRTSRYFFRFFFNGTDEVDFIRNNEWKLVKETIINDDTNTTTESYELYNLKNDPNELTNVLEKEIPIANDLKDKLKQWEQKYKTV